MRVLPAAIGAGLVCLFSVPAAVAQQSADAIWNDLRAKNPPGIDLSLRLIDPHSYREGELIRAEMRLPGSREPTPQPPPEIWQFAGVLLDPPADCGSLASPCLYPMLLQGHFGSTTVYGSAPSPPSQDPLDGAERGQGRYRVLVVCPSSAKWPIHCLTQSRAAHMQSPPPLQMRLQLRCPLNRARDKITGA